MASAADHALALAIGARSWLAQLAAPGQPSACGSPRAALDQSATGMALNSP
jgi:hypothetical protein